MNYKHQIRLGVQISHWHVGDAIASYNSFCLMKSTFHIEVFTKVYGVQNKRTANVLVKPCKSHSCTSKRTTFLADTGNHSWTLMVVISVSFLVFKIGNKYFFTQYILTTVFPASYPTRFASLLHPANTSPSFSLSLENK